MRGTPIRDTDDTDKEVGTGDCFTDHGSISLIEPEIVVKNFTPRGLVVVVVKDL